MRAVLLFMLGAILLLETILTLACVVQLGVECLTELCLAPRPPASIWRMRCRS